jgi:hypothetical protein
VSSLSVAATFISLIRFPDRAFTWARSNGLHGPQMAARMEEMQ